MILHRNKHIMYPLPAISINDYVLQEVIKTRFLGVIIAKSLTWHEHIAHLKGKLSKICGILYLSKSYLPKSAMLMIYYGLVYPHLTYCNTVWGGASRQALRPIEVLQKRVIRTMEGLRKRDHTNPIFHKLDLLKLLDIYIFSCSIYVFKCLKGLAVNSFNLNARNTGYPTRSCNALQTPRVRSCQSETNIKYQGPTTYNKLPSHVKDKPSLPNFKRSLKQHLLNKYANNV